jgi:hypothetical protein
MSDQASIGAGQITEAMAALDFIKGGNSYFTLRSKKTGNRFTYRAAAAAGEEGRVKGWRENASVYFVSVLTGPDNEGDYQYLGIIRDGEFRRTRKSKISETAPSHLAFEWAWRQLAAGKLPDQLEIWHEGCCGRCGRMLTVPESISSGFGPECIRHVGKGGRLV